MLDIWEQEKMAAKTWEADFRYPAIKQSIQRISNQVSDDPFDSHFSLCLPIAARPMIGLTPGKVTLVFLVLGFLFLIGGVGFMSLGKRFDNGQYEGAFTALGACSSLSGMLCFFTPQFLQFRINRWLIGDRGHELIDRAAGGEILCAELSQADKNISISIDGDDHVLMWCDPDNGRVLIEGIAARYLIRQADVISLGPFEFINYIGAEVTYRVGDVELSIAIARVSMLFELIRQLPFLSFLKRRIKNRILEQMAQTLVNTETK
jgi:hypothetical protein